MNLFRKKALTTSSSATNLKRCLTAFDLTLLGIGAIIGAGIFVLTGIAAATQAGPAIICSFLLAGIACAFSALSYAELASSIGGSGSAYNYAYVGFGELIAWIVGWNLLLEYSMACSTVAIGWSGYVNNVLSAVGLALPGYLLKCPLDGGVINLPAALIVMVLAIVLSIGMRESVRFNMFMVFLKLAVVVIFIGIAAFKVHPAYWHPFMPFGWSGMVGGAALVFFAYVGFDAVSTAADEAINPQRDLPIGIIASLLICTVVYMLVAGLLTGITHYSTLNVSSPVASALLHLGDRFAASLIAVGAIAGLTTVILVMFYGFTRIFFAMARDGLLPAFFAVIHPSRYTPIRIIGIAGCVMAALAGLAPIHAVAELVNLSALAVFASVCAGVIVLRYTRPDLPRPFKTPLAPWLPLVGILLSVYLMLHLSALIWLVFLIWTLLGLVVYFAYSRRHSVLARVD